MPPQQSCAALGTALEDAVMYLRSISQHCLCGRGWRNAEREHRDLILPAANYDVDALLPAAGWGTGRIWE